MPNNVEAPICVFNNITNKITQDFEKIIFYNKPDYKFDKNKSLLAINGKIIFNNKSIILMDFIKLENINNELCIKILKPYLKKENFEIINNLTIHWENVNKLFYHYLLMYNNIANGFDDVPIQFIERIVAGIRKKSIKEEEYFVLPYKSKISRIYDEDKKYIENLMNRFSYIIKFSFSSNKFNYKIFRVTPNELNQNKNNLNNLRFNDYDLIVQNNVEISQAHNFITKLFNYGEL